MSQWRRSGDKLTVTATFFKPSLFRRVWNFLTGKKITTVGSGEYLLRIPSTDPEHLKNQKWDEPEDSDWQPYIPRFWIPVNGAPHWVRPLPKNPPEDQITTEELLNFIKEQK